MKVFVTGATGFIGTAIVQDLLQAGHQVVGLSRSATSSEKLKAAGADVQPGDLEDLDSLRSGAAAADGVIHAGFIHDFSRFKEVCEIDKKAIETIGAVLAGSNKPLIVSSGTALVRPGALATEDIPSEIDVHKFPRVSEGTADRVAAQGVRAAAIRLSPSVHGEGDHHGFIPTLINIAREKGKAAYIGDGENRWNAVHRLDAARLFRLALEQGTAKAKYHAVGDEAITLKTIAEIIGRQLNLPVVSIAPAAAADHFGWFAMMASLDCPASSQLTQQRLSWKPTHPGLLEDLNSGIYFK
ncbi:Nucleoside-diphosphate-sugar epimerase [Chitinophaga costaii]|uniref:Nucleoside-diphosphate-sugar epimerase n=1 Tax=Chitinophaga costaii TaxID=1335309 RepID=A0A1C3YP79_9BACT|nr:SDR family oxidoreductase [Chitinophaga costaii]PUZ30036.1 3-beta hydroxysteroid dehydrogenase [Chitinophaga costaii]SCB71907.1 Nucleoside-diphosphate-sugar epimerase [Chitinophaga costaii]